MICGDLCLLPNSQKLWRAWFPSWKNSWGMKSGEWGYRRWRPYRTSPTMGRERTSSWSWVASPSNCLHSSVMYGPKYLGVVGNNRGWSCRWTVQAELKILGQGYGTGVEGWNHWGAEKRRCGYLKQCIGQAPNLSAITYRCAQHTLIHSSLVTSSLREPLKEEKWYWYRIGCDSQDLLMQTWRVWRELTTSSLLPNTGTLER